MSKEKEILKPKKNTTNSYKVKINNEVIPETIEKKPKKLFMSNNRIYNVTPMLKKSN